MSGLMSLGGPDQVLPYGALDIGTVREQLVTRGAPGGCRADGSPFEDTVRTPTEMAVGYNTAAGRASPEDIVDVRDERVLWGGNIVGRVGDFFTEGVSRLWPLLPGGALEGVPATFTAPQRSAIAEEWLKAFGAQTVDLPERGTVHFRQMLVPEPAWKAADWIAPELRDVHLLARGRLDVPPAEARRDILWLSRSRLNRNCAPYDELLLEWLLDDLVTPVHFETQTLGEQVSALESSRGVAGVAGGAFHSLLLTVKPPDSLYLLPAIDRSPYTAQQRLIDARATFAPAVASTMQMRRARERGRLYPGDHRVLIPQALRAFGSSVLPALREDRRLATFAEADRPPGAPGLRATPADELDAAAMRVVRNPLAFDQRMALAEMFEERNLTKCAAEQYIMVAELSEDLEEPARRAARRMDSESSGVTGRRPGAGD